MLQDANKGVSDTIIIWYLDDNNDNDDDFEHCFKTFYDFMISLEHVIQTEFILIQQLFIKHLKCTRFFSMCIWYISEQNRDPWCLHSVWGGQTYNMHSKVIYHRV